MKKRFTSLFLVFVLVSTSFCAVSAQETYATRKQVLEMILSAADDYYEGIQASDIMKGDGDGNLRENEPVIRVEAMAMISRAFPDLQDASEYQLSIGNFGITFTDLPQWAEADLGNLTRAGIIAGYPDGRLGINDNVTIEQMTLLIRRIWAYIGNNLKDDFYASHNKPWLDLASLSADQFAVSSFQQAGDQTEERLQEIIKEMEKGNWKTDSKQQRVKDFYLAALDVTTQNELGIEPIEEPLEIYDEIATVQDLLDFHAILCDVTGDPSILGLSTDVDVKEADQYVPYVTGPSSILEKSYFTNEDEGAKQAYIAYVSSFLEIGGEQPREAKRHAEQLFEMEKDIALASLNPNEYWDLDKAYKRYSLKEFNNLFPKGASPEDLMEGKDKLGFYVINDEGRVLKTIEYLKEENLEVLKTYMKFWLLQSCSSLLGETFDQPIAEFYQALYGVNYSITPEDKASLLVQGYLGECLEEDYATKYCSPQIKEKATDLAEQLRDSFKTRIQQSDWMSKETKKKAVEKLDEMIINVAYPEEYYDMFEGAPPFQHDLFSNALYVQATYNMIYDLMIGRPSNRTSWPMSCYTVNAAYHPNKNSITIPAGILQEPLYDPEKSLEENLGGIGVVIGHEITHAFDSEGSKYNANGKYQNWWTDQDWNVFQQKCKQVEEFYHGWEISNHAKCDGTLTLSENIADIGGMACALDVMKTLENPNYNQFFESFAESWKSFSRREMVDYMSKNDVHAPDKLRVNRTVVNFQEFYDAYQIEPGDGMYVAPEDRIHIW